MLATAVAMLVFDGPESGQQSLCARCPNTAICYFPSLQGADMSFLLIMAGTPECTPLALIHSTFVRNIYWDSFSS